MAAAMRASMAVFRQEERGVVQERSAPKHCREERTEPEDPRHRVGHVKPPSEPPGEKRLNNALSQPSGPNKKDRT